MAVVLDTADHPAGDRADLVHEVIANSGARTRVALHAPAESVELRAEVWEAGPVRVLSTTGTGLTLTRTARDVHRDAPELVALGMSAGPCRYSVGDRTEAFGLGSFFLVDFATPYSFAHAGRRGTSFAAHIDYARLDLGVDDVRTAIPRLTANPLMPLVRGHLTQLFAAIDEVAGAPAVAADVGAATVDLTRALIVSAAGSRRQRDVLHETLRTQIVAHVRAHLRDRDLTPARIAAAHHISVRTLYKVWGDQDGTLIDWIIRERLERVRRELVLAAPGSTIFAVARTWGFVNAAHFSRRFRAAYGMSPQEWLHRSRSRATARD
jgi:AraC-like DNA-binding protein